jgi:hypothetical protein
MAVGDVAHDPLWRIINVNWGGPIIQMSIKCAENDVDGLVPPDPPEGQFLLAEIGKEFTVKDFTVKIEGEEDIKYWFNGVTSADAPGNDFDYVVDPPIADHYREYLLYFSFHPNKGNQDNPPVARVEMTDTGDRGAGGGTARLRIYPGGVTWRVEGGTPKRLRAISVNEGTVVDVSPSYDSSKSTSGNATWYFNVNGWL